MGKVKAWVMENFSLEGTWSRAPLDNDDDREENFYPAGRYTVLQAKMFIKTINSVEIRMTDDYLGLFDKELIQYAVNLARMVKRETPHNFSEWNQFSDAKKYREIMNYLKRTSK